jgi:hypothetical protein
MFLFFYHEMVLHFVADTEEHNSKQERRQQ